MRESGMLFPIFSLPSKFGIGCFSKEAYEFVDFLESSGQGFWQILPIGPTGFGNSPYQPFSAFAGNPYFISPEKLIEDGLLTWDECNAAYFGSNEECVDYGALYENRFPLLKKAYERFTERLKEETALKEAYEAFLRKEAFWLEDYAMFTALKDAKNGASWLTWEEDLKKREKKALLKVKEELSQEIGFVCFEQYAFDRQWNRLRQYANQKNVKIIGDLPFYVSLDSADAWSHPEVFLMTEDLTPKVVAGCPPDAFSRTGQLWGNPIYDWKALAKSGYGWWIERMKRNYEFYDVIRVDHFHGFCEYYAIPYQDKTAENGTFEKGPGMDLFRALEKALGSLRIIAEDLGNNTPENEELLKETGFPGMKVLQYGFTSWDSYYVNHRHIRNCVVYTGTHDNTPTRAWIEEITDGERDFTRRYINSRNTDYGQFVWDFIREAYRSVADLCVIPLQDYLCKGKEARINSPGTSEGNWQWRLKPNFLSKELSMSIREMTETYSRIPKAPEAQNGTEKNNS
ncbi:MAG: 4-alpha-glucanotransferase [Lachnospiraceae bacterium]|nr:4-alpha-glucanotransferase [Lachnospiraceae bacterium]